MIKLKTLLNESKYKAHVFADVVDDIVTDEKFKNVDRTEENRGDVYIYIKDRDKKSIGDIANTLKSKYGVEGVKWNEGESAIVVPGSSLVEATSANLSESAPSWKAAEVSIAGQTLYFPEEGKMYKMSDSEFEDWKDMSTAGRDRVAKKYYKKAKKDTGRKGDFSKYLDQGGRDWD